MSFDPTARPKYRADIDGLRAIAVLAVVGFHAFPFWFRGGFIGVDVFFVISGFLISSIIFENLEKGSFSFYEFYERRIKRIFPSLVVVLISVYVLGWFLLLPDEYKQLGKNIAGGAGFVSNFLYWMESGYFDTATITKPLVHLWSLSIEEQFYIFWPLLLGFVYKRKRNLLGITVLIASISFAVNVLTIDAYPTTAFYVPVGRFWELMIGGVLAYRTLHRRQFVVSNANLQSMAGVLLIGVGVFSGVLNKSSAFPGWWALLPTTGTYLAISAGPGGWFSRAVLSNRMLVWFGLISYPLYLWHWPLISLVSIHDGDINDVPRNLRILVVGASIVLAWLTFRFVERPIRHSGKGGPLVIALCVVMLLIGVGGVSTYVANGLSFRYPEFVNEASFLTNYDYLGGKTVSDFWGSGSCFEVEGDYRSFERNHCTEIKHPERPTVFLIGDSHSAYLSPGLRPFLELHALNLMQVSSGYCLPLADSDRRDGCVRISAFISDTIARTRPDVVILFGNYINHTDPQSSNGSMISYEEFLFAKLQEIKNSGAKNVIFIGQIPTWKGSLPHTLVKNFLLNKMEIPRKTYTGIQQDSMDWDLRMKMRHYPEGITYVSLRDALCDGQGCLTMVGADLPKDLIVWDYGHLTQSGAKYVTDRTIVPIFDGLGVYDSK